jgi:phage baseplate assembly protein W
MDYTVSSNETLINWNANGTERILQNVNNILNTIKYEVPYDRLMGRDPNNIDTVLNKSKYSIMEETYNLINTYEPRATVKSVDIEGTESPIIKVVVTID